MITILATGCVTQHRCNKKFPPSTQTTEKDSSKHSSNIKKTKEDNLFIYIRDSINVNITDSMIYNYFFRTLYRDRYIHDTIVITDSTFSKNEKTEKEVVVVNELTKSQKIQVKAFWVMAVGVLIVSVYKVARFIN